MQPGVKDAQPVEELSRENKKKCAPHADGYISHSSSVGSYGIPAYPEKMKLALSFKLWKNVSERQENQYLANIQCCFVIVEESALT